MGPRRVTLAAGLLNALSVINLAKADQQQQTTIERQDRLLDIFEQAIDHQTEGDVGSNAQNVHEPGTSSHGDCSVRVVQDQEI